MQIMYVVGASWVGVAAKLGTSHTVFWLLAIAFYYLPQAAVVIFLSRLMPLEGGLYQWTTIALGRFAGFMVAWNLWAYAIVIAAGFGVTIATNAAYVFSGSSATLSSIWWYTPLVSTLVLLGVTMISVLGLRIGRWVQDVGGAGHVLTFAALLIVPLVALAHGRPVAYHPLKVSAPTFTPYSLNILGKMGLGALSGFEYVAIMAGETRSASRNITRSVLVAAPIIALMVILGTDSVIALVPQDRIDLVSPIPQALSVGFAGTGAVQLIAPALILLLLLRHMGVVTMVFNGNTRLPLVAGWDNLLPSWFTRLHPRFRTPVNSILVVSAITIAFSLAGQIGVGVQEAFQLLENAAGILYAFHVPGAVCDSTFRRRESSAEAAAVAQDRVSVRVRDGAALLDAIGVSDYRGGELADIRAVDHHGDSGRECHWDRDLRQRRTLATESTVRAEIPTVVWLPVASETKRRRELRHVRTRIVS